MCNYKHHHLRNQRYRHLSSLYPPPWGRQNHSHRLLAADILPPNPLHPNPIPHPTPILLSKLHRYKTLLVGRQACLERDTHLGAGVGVVVRNKQRRRRTFHQGHSRLVSRSVFDSVRFERKVHHHTPGLSNRGRTCTLLGMRRLARILIHEGSLPAYKSVFLNVRQKHTSLPRTLHSTTDHNHRTESELVKAPASA